MRAVLAIIILFCLGCHNAPAPEFIPAHSRKVAVKLMDSLGVVTMYVPERYDTGFAWYHDSDCSSCGKMKCRFQSSSWRMYRESGFFFFPPTDSVDRVTIIYAPHDFQEIGDSAFIYYNNKYFREVLKTEGEGPECILIDTNYTINGRPFSITGTHRYIDWLCRDFYELNAMSTVRSVCVTIQFELITERGTAIDSNFLQNTLDLIKTIRFTEPI